MTEPLIRRPFSTAQLDLLPFDFENPYFILPETDDNDLTYFATWHDRLCWTLDLTQPLSWTFADNDLDITVQDWERFYPGFLQLDSVHLQPTLTGVYNNQQTRWSKTQNRWTYNNHRPVIFDNEEEDVDRALSSATETLQRTREKLTPDLSSASLPGTFDTSEPLPVHTKPEPPEHFSTPSTSLSNPIPPSTSQIRFPTGPKTPIQQPTPPVSKVVPTMSAPATTTNAKTVGTPPEPFDGTLTKADAF